MSIQAKYADMYMYPVKRSVAGVALGNVFLICNSD